LADLHKSKEPILITEHIALDNFDAAVHLVQKVFQL